MTPSQIKKRLLEAQKIWELESQNSDIAGLPGYMPGVIKGFEETLRIVREMHREDVGKSTALRKRVPRRNTAALYHACRQAYGRLRYSDREGALRALKKALEAIET